jgi:hypothetical protein
MKSGKKKYQSKKFCKAKKTTIKRMTTKSNRKKNGGLNHKKNNFKNYL